TADDDVVHLGECGRQTQRDVRGALTLEEDGAEVRGRAHRPRRTGAIRRVVRIELSRIDPAVLVLVLGAVHDPVTIGVGLGRIRGGRGIRVRTEDASARRVGRRVLGRRQADLLAVGGSVAVGVEEPGVRPARVHHAVLVCVLDPVRDAVAVAVHAAGIGLTGVHHAVAVRILDAVRNPVAVGVGVVRIGARRELDLVRDAVLIGVHDVLGAAVRPIQRVGLMRVEHAVLVDVLGGIHAPIPVGVRVEGVGAHEVDLDAVARSVAVGVAVEGIGLVAILATVPVHILLTVRQAVAVGVRVVGIHLVGIDLAVAVAILAPVDAPPAVRAAPDRAGGPGGRRPPHEDAGAVRVDGLGATELHAVRNPVTVGIGEPRVGLEAPGVYLRVLLVVAQPITVRVDVRVLGVVGIGLHRLWRDVLLPITVLLLTGIRLAAIAAVVAGIEAGVVAGVRKIFAAPAVAAAAEGDREEREQK